jgi:hypothetical protein
MGKRVQERAGVFHTVHFGDLIQLFSECFTSLEFMATNWAGVLIEIDWMVSEQKCW